MPLYEYQCTRCGHRTEVIQRFDDPPLTVCEECGGELKKLLSAPAFQFKGSGWYVTDYAGKKGGADGSESKKSASAKDDSSASPAPASDTKPAASGGDSTPAPAASTPKPASGD